jgi:putative multiple sugar transport system substrate-binding protein
MFIRGHARLLSAVLIGILLAIPIAAPVLNAAPSQTAGPDAPAGDSIDIGIVLPAEDPRWQQDAAQFTKWLSGSGYTFQLLFSQNDSAIEKTHVEALISQGIGVLILCPVDSSGATAAVEEARAAGAKVIAYDRLILNTPAVDYYLTFDGIAVGRAQGQYLIDHATGARRPLYLYAGHPADNNTVLFFEGSWEVLQPKIADGTFAIKNSSAAVALQSYPTLTHDEQAGIINQITTNWDWDAAQALAQANLAAVTAADKCNVFVLAPSDGISRAIGDVFAGDPDITGTVITGQDADKDSVQYIIDGKQSMTVFKDVRTLARDAAAAAITYLEGGAPVADMTTFNGVIEVPSHSSKVVSVDKDNLVPALIDSGYYQLSDFTWPVISTEIDSGGGHLTSDFDSTTYSFASGTFADSVLITHTVTFASPPTGKLAGIGHSFDLAATTSDTGKEVQPQQPYFVSIHYTDGQRGVVKESTLALYSQENGQWIKEATSTVDAGSNTVTATPSHLSSWLVMGEIQRVYLPLALRSNTGR